MSERVQQADTSADRSCLGCGYSLRGLGAEPRCPECGLLNVPQGYREEVWKLVDSGKWFFSGFFHPFKKRPPGWWWALDRPGDVKRSWRFAATNTALSAALIWLACLGSELYKLEITGTALCYDPANMEMPPLARTMDKQWIGSLGHRENTPTNMDSQRCAPGRTLRAALSAQIVFRPSFPAMFDVLVPLLIVWTPWLFPAIVGLVTQIRREMPLFAKPKRTIIAAANYESHRMLYPTAVLCMAIGVWTWIVLDGTLLFSLGTRGPGVASILWAMKFPIIAILVLLLLGAVGWTGPFNSDYTRQLIRSRWHAARVLVIYGFLLPLVTTMIVLAFCVTRAI